jgi:hypothetical protein
MGLSVSPGGRHLVPLKECPYDKTKAPECRVHWRQLLISSAIFLTWQNTANVYSSYWCRHQTLTGNWWERYVNSVVGYKFSVWSDGNPLLDVYVGHPLMGAITNALWIQNDPRGMTLEFSNAAILAESAAGDGVFGGLQHGVEAWGLSASRELGIRATTYRTRTRPAGSGTRPGLSAW